MAQLRDHPAIVSKNDAFRVDPRLLITDPTFNVRDLDAPAAREDLDELKEDIREHGVQDPLEVRLSGDDLIVCSGHRRLKVVLELIDEGEDFKSIPAVAEPKGLTDADRVARIHTLNLSHPLTPLEKSELVRRLKNVFGWTHAEVAKSIGVKSLSMVDRYLEMSALPEPMRDAVRNDEISATNAVQMVKDQGPLLAEQTLDQARETAKARGKERVTAKSILRPAAKVRKVAPGVDLMPAPPSGNIAKTDKAISALREVIDAGYTPQRAAAPMLISATDIDRISKWLADIADALRAKKAA